VLAPGGLVANAAPGARGLQLRPREIEDTGQVRKPSPDVMRDLLEDVGFVVIDQHRIPRPVWTRVVFDFITTGTKSEVDDTASDASTRDQIPIA
jgi:hypothetical protein